MPRPSSTTVTELSMWIVTSIVVAEAGEGLVDRVVDDLVDEVVQPRLAGRADVHRRADADGLEALEDPDGLRPVVRRRRVALPGLGLAHDSHSVAGGRAHAHRDASLRDVVDSAERPQALRPARVCARDERLSPPRDLGAQLHRALGVELGVEVVEEGDRRAAGLLAVDAQRGEGQRQEEAPDLAGRGAEGGVAAVEEERHRVAVRPDEAAAGAPLARRDGVDLRGQRAAAVVLARRPRAATSVTR